jgi:predicted AAA+ superfamily ATPase
MIPRTLQSTLVRLAKQFPALAILGPRQSGKTTLAKMLFPTYRYVNLESFEEREFAEEDGKGFLARFKNEPGIILDEIQKAPKLLSYIQMEIDEGEQLGRFILASSQNILLNQHISQTLAGRIALTTLLPLSIEELRNANKLPESASSAIFQGFYTGIYQNQLDPVVFAESYVRTYVERDVRDLKQITSLSDFQKFMRLCAARIGQLLNIASLATEAGLSVATVKSWISILEATYVIFLLQPHHINYNKRSVKMPKLYFYDTSLACNLLRLTNSDDVYDHYLRGGLFESMILSNLLKNRYHHALPPNAYFWRDKVGVEVDCLLEEGSQVRPIEIKSSETINQSLFDGLIKWTELSGTDLDKANLIYGGLENQKRSGIQVISWRFI